MFSVLITSLVHICLLANGSTIGKLRQDARANYSSKDNPPRVMQQTFKINNWGFDNSDRQILIELKQKIDSLHGENEKCNRGWIRFGNSRFLIINVPTLKWSDARRTCQMLGGDLPIIRSAAENTFIFDLVKKQKTITDFGVWLGFVRKADNKFYWIDDTPLKGRYAPWGQGEPNSVLEKCGNIFGKRPPVGKWNDLSCSLSVNDLKNAPSILCQKKAN